jgi:hypothetical protein
MTNWDLSGVAGPISFCLAVLLGAGGGAPHKAEGPAGGFRILVTGEKVGGGRVLEAA